MEPKTFFLKPLNPLQKQYEALKAFYVNGLSSARVCKQFGLSQAYFKKLRFLFVKKLKQGINSFFPTIKTGPKQRRTPKTTIEEIVLLRKRNYAITDIQVHLNAKQIKLSLNAIDEILKSEGFAPLPKRTRIERLSTMLPEKFKAPRSISLTTMNDEFTTEISAGPLLFLPLMQKLGIVNAIEKSGFPGTKDLSGTQMVLSFLALKLLGTKRWSHDCRWNMDRALGLFANLNVLPKSTTLSTYGYRISRKSNRELLLQLASIFEDNSLEFNLDFKTIPYWGDAGVLEKNWSGSHRKAMKSILALIAENPDSGTLTYTNAEIKHREQNYAVLEFVDFWKQKGTCPKLLIFDSRFTTYHNLHKLNQDGIKFLTLRRRGKELIKSTSSINSWQKITIERSKGRYQTINVLDRKCSLRHYDGEVREIIITGHGREKPAFLITNDFDLEVKELIKKYARRWLVEQEIAEQILFFQLNHPSSSIVIKVDFDLTLSLLAHNLYKKLAKELIGFEHCTVDTINRKFLENGAKIIIKDKMVSIFLKKKTHLPLLLETSLLKEEILLSWMGLSIRFVAGTVC